MKFLTITKSKPIKLSVDTALKAGTPISIMGEVANDASAIGLVANDTAAGTESIAIVTEGMVDVNEIAASYGEALTDDCIAALKGITFLHGGKAIVPAGGGGGSGLPDYSEASDGDVLSIENGAPAWKEPGGGDLFIVKIAEDETTGDMMADKNYNEISAAVSSGTPVVGVVIWQDLEMVCDTVVVNNSGATFTGYFSEVSGSSLELAVQKYMLYKGSSGTSYNVGYDEYTFTIS